MAAYAGSRIDCQKPGRTSGRQVCSNRRKGRSSRQGFTLIELLVATVFVAIALTGVMGGIRALTIADARAQKVELLQSLAMQKLYDLEAVDTVTTAATSGDFTDQGYPNVSWQVQVDQSSVTNIDDVTVTATLGDLQQKVTTQLYIPPTTTGTPATAGGATQ